VEYDYETLPLIFIGLLLFSTTTPAVEKVSPKQVDEVQQRTQQVVPYALDQTLQTFPKLFMAAFSMLSSISRQYRANKIDQANLLKMASDFRKGDFSVTEHIHGADMPVSPG